MERRIRILVGKTGLDGHDIGIKVISAMLRDAGMEVIYIGPYHTPENVVSIALQEGVDFIGLSFLGGDHIEQTAKMTGLLNEKGLSIPLIVGGVIPRQDFEALKAVGVAEVFEAGSSPEYIIRRIRDLQKQRLGSSTEMRL